MNNNMSKNTEDKIQTNLRNCLDLNLELPTRARLMLTAPKDQDFWLFGVALTKTHMLVAVPEFGGVNLHLRTKSASDYVAPYEATEHCIIKLLRERLMDAVSTREIKAARRLLRKQIRAWRGCNIACQTKGKQG
jgi:hypothetical protein